MRFNPLVHAPHVPPTQQTGGLAQTPQVRSLQYAASGGVNNTLALHHGIQAVAHAQHARRAA
jgi:hypothetical protein